MIHIILSVLVLISFYLNNKKQNKVMATLAEQVQEITGIVLKAKGEIVAKIDSLEAVIAEQGDVEAAIAELRTAVTGLDDLNPDAPTPEPEPAIEE